MNRRWTSRWTGPVSALVCLLVAVLVLVTAYGYSRQSGLFPIFIGWIFLVLALAESIIRLRQLARDGRGVPADAGTGLVAVDRGAMVREAAGILWVCAFLAAVYIVGFVAATLLFLFSFLRFAAGRRLSYAAAAGLVATAVVYGVFAWLLEYRLYPGLLFGG